MSSSSIIGSFLRGAQANFLAAAQVHTSVEWSARRGSAHSPTAEQASKAALASSALVWLSAESLRRIAVLTVQLGQPWQMQRVSVQISEQAMLFVAELVHSWQALWVSAQSVQAQLFVGQMIQTGKRREQHQPLRMLSTTWTQGFEPALC
jgi:hypothetical protein